MFGRRAGLYAAEAAGRQKSPPTINTAEVDAAAREAVEPFERTEGENPYALHEELRSVMQDLVGIVRQEGELNSALDKLNQLRERAKRVKIGGNIQFNPGWHLALDLKNMLDVSEAVTRAALERKESRGGHTRDDFADSDPHWAKLNVIVRQGPKGIELSQRALPEMPPDLAKLVKESVDG